MTQRSVFLEGVFTLRNLRSAGAAAILEVLIAFGIAAALIWQQVQTGTRVQPKVPPITVFPEQAIPLKHDTPVPQAPELQQQWEVPPVPALLPTQNAVPVQGPLPPLVPGLQSHASSDPTSEFSASMLLAINAQKAYPKAALLRGETGETSVSFDYVDGVVSNIQVDKSSGSQELDAAAVAAVKKARLPSKPAELAGQSRFSVVLDFSLGG